MASFAENSISMKNVAAEPAEKICQSVGRKLKGKVVSTSSRISLELQEAVRESLTQITFWLNENNHRVMIAAGDTSLAGAVEQLGPTKHLNALHPNSVQLFEQGYGKDSASLAATAIGIANERGIDVVLVDTAGRMQDNKPLMRELAKLIRVNEPELVLFGGEALVGNEAVDQLVKFNQARDFSFLFFACRE
ncbi:unnamed protein product [Nippostrongylus brasiliensis]|uniref:SRP54 domain-containing protein n=1 Tax=Nippostrongylus brasiliensis TaxID=27835 RepID=A0A0N4YL77_NIPBR|nr:unnamed protein product [Nippostrongylus brasiliensis]